MARCGVELGSDCRQTASSKRPSKQSARGLIDEEGQEASGTLFVTHKQRNTPS